jgi:hypothetical protein
MLLGLLLAAGPAHAARNELSFEWMGTFPADRGFDGLYDAPRLDGYGVRGGYAVVRDKHRMGLVIDAGWNRARRGARAYGYDLDYDESVGPAYPVDQLVARYTADTFLIGLKADVDVGNVWYPYLHAQAGLIAAGAQLDSDPSSDRDGNQLRDRALTGAGVFTAGFELMIPDRRLGWPVTAAIFAEAGYQLAGDLRFETFGGPLNPSGAVVRAGIGLRL